MPETEQFRAIATAMLDRRIRNMRRLDEKTWIDTSLITHAEYQLFLDEMYAQGKYYQPDHWKEKRFPPGEAFTPVVGLRFSDAKAFCDWLTTQEWSRFRLPTNEETINIEDTLPGFWQVANKGEVEVNYGYKGRPLIRDAGFGTNDFITSLHSFVDFSQELDLDRVYTVNLSFEVTHKDRDLDRAVSLARALKHERKSFFNSIQALFLSTDLEKVDARDRASKFARFLVDKLTRGRDSKIDQTDILQLFYDLVSFFGTEEKEFKILIPNLSILSLRREGLLPAFEGILIVREEADHA